MTRSQPSIASIIHELRVSGDPTEEAWADAIETLKARIEELEGALRALRLQALQSSVNSPANEWGMEALELANAALQPKAGS